MCRVPRSCAALEDSCLEATSSVGVLMVLFGAGQQLVCDFGGRNQAKAMIGIGGLLEAVGAIWIVGSHSSKRPVNRTAYALYGAGLLAVIASLILGRRAESVE